MHRNPPDLYWDVADNFDVVLCKEVSFLFANSRSALGLKFQVISVLPRAGMVI